MTAAKTKHIGAITQPIKGIHKKKPPVTNKTKNDNSNGNLYRITSLDLHFLQLGDFNVNFSFLKLAPHLTQFCAFVLVCPMHSGQNICAIIIPFVYFEKAYHDRILEARDI